jgi:hypothetical protein
MKGSKCWSCGAQKVKQTDTGMWQCGSCDALSWTPFDVPRAGRTRRGSTCEWCRGLTVHPVGEVAGAEILRCSACASTIIRKKG